MCPNEVRAEKAEAASKQMPCGHEARYSDPENDGGECQVCWLAESMIANRERAERAEKLAGAERAYRVAIEEHINAGTTFSPKKDAARLALVEAGGKP